MLYVVSAPLFEGRPELTIIECFEQQLTPEIEYEIIRPTISPNPGSDVYNNRVMVDYYVNTAYKLAQVLVDNDKVFWVDAQNPALPILCQLLLRTKVKHYGIFHSSPLIEADYLHGTTWGSLYHRFLMETLDAIFVATNYMKTMCCSNRHQDSKTYVTGLPIDTRLVQNKLKTNSIVFSHRCSEDKNFELYLKLAETYHHLLEFKVFTPDLYTYEKIRSIPYITSVFNRTKSEYFENLSTVKFVFAHSKLETFGYSVIEAYLSGAIPVLNAHPCYSELFPECIYHSIEELMAMLTNPIDHSTIVYNGKHTDCVQQMLNYIEV